MNQLMLIYTLCMSLILSLSGDLESYNELREELTWQEQEEFPLDENYIYKMDYQTFLYKNDYKIGAEFCLENTEFNDNTYLLDFQQADINGDNIDDNILMTGVHLPDYSEPYHDHITIIIQNGKNRNLIFLSPIYGHGYEYRIFLGDFDGDRVKDIFFEVANDFIGGGGDYTFAIYSFKGNQFNLLLNNNEIYMETYPKIEFMDNFKMMIACPHLDKKVIVDIGVNKDKYQELNLYTGNKLIKEIKGYTDNYCMLMPIDIDRDGVYELEGYQFVSGYGHADGIGMVNTILKRNDKKKWILKYFEFEQFED